MPTPHPAPELRTAVWRTNAGPEPPARLPASYLVLSLICQQGLSGEFGAGRPAQNSSPRGAPGGSEPLPSMLPIHFRGQGSNGHCPEPLCADAAHEALFCGSVQGTETCRPH